MSMRVIGLTGGIGSGKTYVSACFERLGVDVIDADVISRALTAPGGEALDDIRRCFGNGIFDEKGALRREKLRQKVFSAPHRLRTLEGILHPLIRDKISRRIAAACGDYGVLSVPLLWEGDLWQLCHRVVVVDIDRRRQVLRTRHRDETNAAGVVAIMRQQTSRLYKLTRADFVIDNRADPWATFAQVESLHRRLARPRSRHPAPFSSSQVSDHP